MAARPWPLLNTHDCSGDPTPLGFRLSAVGLFSVPAGDGQPTTLPWWEDGVLGLLWDSETSGQTFEEVDERVDVMGGLVSVPSFRGCSWRIDN